MICDKMKNEEQLLRLFYREDENRPNISKPFLQDGFVCASDGHMLIRIDESIYDSHLGYKETVDGLKPPVVSKVMPEMQIDEELTLDYLKDIIRKFPVDDYDYLCSECGGSGYVDWSYTGFDGTVYHLHDTCPVCGGIGEIDRYESAYAQFMIHGNAFGYGCIDTLIRAMNMMEIDRLVIRYALEDSMRPVLLTTEDKKVQILMMPQNKCQSLTHIDII